jgi:hypothetical protein
MPDGSIWADLTFNIQNTIATSVMASIWGLEKTG